MVAHGRAPPRRHSRQCRSRPPGGRGATSWGPKQPGTFQHFEDALAVLVAGVQKLGMDGDDIEDQLKSALARRTRWPILHAR